MTTAITAAGTISTPGSYYLNADIVVSGNSGGILISCDDVTLNLNGHSIRSSGGAGSTGRGISTSGTRNRISIIGNGGHISGFYAGIWMGDGSYTNLTTDAGADDFSVEGVSVDHCYFRGIRLESRGASVKNCRVSNITGCTVYQDAYCMGVELFGAASDVCGNRIYDVLGMGETGEGVGISTTSYGQGSRIKNNLISNTDLTNSGSYSVWCGGAATSLSSTVIKDNEFANYVNAIAVSATNIGTYEDNTFLNVTNQAVGNVSLSDAGSNFNL